MAPLIPVAFNFIASLISANASKVRTIKNTLKVIPEKLPRSSIDIVVTKMMEKLDSPWWLSKRLGATVGGVCLWVFNTKLGLDLPPVALEYITYLIMCYVGGKSVEQFKR